MFVVALSARTMILWIQMKVLHSAVEIFNGQLAVWLQQ
jgi:hypothetical protein